MKSPDDDEGKLTYSQKLNKKSRKQQFRVELLTPRGSIDSSVQRYTSSGWRLGPVAGTMVLSLIDLSPAAAAKGAPLEARRSDAFLPIEKVPELQEQGLAPVALNRDGDLARYVKGNDPEAAQIEGWSPHGRCYSCKSSWHDHTKGEIVPCVECKRRYHQECTKPAIRSNEIGTWLCPVCTGHDTSLCTKCGEPFSEQEVLDAASLENNELVQCQTCSAWWHQACHEPALYPLPLYPLPLEFVCANCPKQAAANNAQPQARPQVQRPAAARPQRQAPRPQMQPQIDRPRRATAIYNSAQQTQATNAVKLGPSWASIGQRSNDHSKA